MTKYKVVRLDAFPTYNVFRVHETGYVEVLFLGGWHYSGTGGLGEQHGRAMGLLEAIETLAQISWRDTRNFVESI